MRYVSVAGSKPVTFGYAASHNLAEDGALYVPKDPVDINHRQLALARRESFCAFCAEFLSGYTDLPVAALRTQLGEAYATFGHEPDLVDIGASTRLYRLASGPTQSFKDYGVGFAARYFASIASVLQAPVTVVCATSGDTGAATAATFANVPGTSAFILYPKDGVSTVQENQIAGTGADNVYALPISGSLDDAQAAVKLVLKQERSVKERLLVSANSINVVRLVAQVAYWAWLLTSDGVDECEVVIPTGNMGNAFSYWLAARALGKRPRLMLATNANAGLANLVIGHGYSARPVVKTLATAMDIARPSNLDRFLYYMAKDCHVSFGRNYVFDRLVFAAAIDWSAWGIEAASVEDCHIAATVEGAARLVGYDLDPHTACGVYAACNHSLYREHIVAETALASKLKPADPSPARRVFSLRGYLPDALTKFIEAHE